VFFKHGKSITALLNNRGQIRFKKKIVSKNNWGQIVGQQFIDTNWEKQKHYLNSTYTLEPPNHGQLDYKTEDYELLALSQIIRHLTFLTLSLTTRLIQKFVQNIISFVVACFINKSYSRMT